MDRLDRPGQHRVDPQFVGYRLAWGGWTILATVGAREDAVHQIAREEAMRRTK